MTTLRYSQLLGRVVRQDPAEQLGKPTRQLLEEELSAGNVEGTIDLLNYLFTEHKIIRDINCVFAWHIAHLILDRGGSDSRESLIRESLAPWIGTTCGLAGQPLAAVDSIGQGARLTIPGAPWEVHIDEGNECFEITLGSPTDFACVGKSNAPKS